MTNLSNLVEKTCRVIEGVIHGKNPLPNKHYHRIPFLDLVQLLSGVWNGLLTCNKQLHMYVVAALPP